jgi:hypothetical protein
VIKKIIQIVLIIFSLGLVAYVYYKFNSSEDTYQDSLAVLPADVSFVMELDGFSAFGKYEGWLQSVVQRSNAVSGVEMNPVKDWYGLLNALDSLRTANLNWATLLDKSHVAIACAEQGRKDTWMATIGLKEGSSSGDAADLIGPWLGEGTKRDFKGVSIIAHSEGLIHETAFINNCLVFASSSSIMDGIIIQNEKKNVLINQRSFVDAKEVVSKDIPVHFFFSLEHNEWLQLDPLLSEGKQLLSGYAMLSDTTKNGMRLCGDAGTIQIAKHLPVTTSMLDVWCYNDFDNGWSQHESFYAGSNASLFWGQAWKDLGDSCQCDLNETMLSWRGGEWGAAMIAESDSSSDEILFFSLKDSIDVMKLMKPLLVETALDLNGIHRLRHPILFERNKSTTILVEVNYITQQGEYVFVASTPEDLNSILLNGFTSSLADKPSYRQAINTLGGKPARFTYQDEYYTSPLPRHVLNIFGGGEFMAIGIENLKNNKYLVNVALPSDGVLAAVATDTLLESGVLWNSSLDAPVARGPWIVTNHNTGLKEVLLQDENKQLCLFGSDGKRLWVKKMSDFIIGKVTQIDALKNGKLQLAFTTSNELCIVDRNGNNLAGFPVNVGSRITTELFVFDYEINKNYRLIFGTDNGMFNNYSVSAKATEGWKYQGEGIPAYADCFRVNNEDFLLFYLKDGKVKLLKRNGESRTTNGTTMADYNGGEVLVHPSNTESEILLTYCDKSGNVKQLAMGQDKNKQVAGGWSSNALVSFDDVDMDNKKDFVVADGKVLSVISSEGRKLFAVTLSNDILYAPQVLRKSNTEISVAAISSDGKIYVVSSTGEVKEGYPKEATSLAGMADLNGDKKSDVVVTVGDQVRVYTK